MSSSTIETRPLSPERLKDFLALFDGEAFSDNPKWSSCYCQCFYEDHSRVHWAGRMAQENRERACQRTANGAMQEPIPDSEQVGTILCFLVAPRLRGRGVAMALLNAACEGLRAQGLRYAEANPRPDATAPAENHFGPLRMYLAADFTVRRTDDDGSVWVGREL